jgi:hypothetical protein
VDAGVESEPGVAVGNFVSLDGPLDCSQTCLRCSRWFVQGGRPFGEEGCVRDNDPVGRPCCDGERG